MFSLGGRVGFYDNLECFGLIHPFDGGDPIYFQGLNVTFAGADKGLAGGEVVNFNLLEPKNGKEEGDPPFGRFEAIDIHGRISKGVPKPVKGRIVRTILGSECCHRCYGRGHLKKDCPSNDDGCVFSGVKCYTCFGAGHQSIACPSHGGGASLFGPKCVSCNGIGHGQNDCVKHKIRGVSCKVCCGSGHNSKICPNLTDLAKRGVGCTICKCVDHIARKCTNLEAREEEEKKLVASEKSVVEAAEKKLVASEKSVVEAAEAKAGD